MRHPSPFWAPYHNNPDNLPVFFRYKAFPTAFATEGPFLFTLKLQKWCCKKQKPEKAKSGTLAKKPAAAKPGLLERGRAN
jgi:hypothetical protein